MRILIAVLSWLCAQSVLAGDLVLEAPANKTRLVVKDGDLGTAVAGRVVGSRSEYFRQPVNASDPKNTVDGCRCEVYFSELVFRQGQYLFSSGWLGTTPPTHDMCTRGRYVREVPMEKILELFKLTPAQAGVSPNPVGDIVIMAYDKANPDVAHVGIGNYSFDLEFLVEPRVRVTLTKSPDKKPAKN